MNATEAAASMAKVADGFSLTNRLILYLSLLLSPAQFVSGLGSNWFNGLANLGFLAFNIYNQVIWYRAVRGHQFHALSLVVSHFNLIYAGTYMGGVTAGNMTVGTFLALGTCALLCFNTATAWIAWQTNLPDGFGIYQFFFFGWRTLSHNWHIFILLWQIADTMLAASMVVGLLSSFWKLADTQLRDFKWWYQYIMIPLGAAAVILVAWPLILWTELIVQRNHIVSDTDKNSVRLFVVQVALLLILPYVDWLLSRFSCLSCFSCFRRSE